jgi:two-component system cell cycle sensor histidine kinase/response regulator CckA
VGARTLVWIGIVGVEFVIGGLGLWQARAARTRAPWLVGSAGLIVVAVGQALRFASGSTERGIAGPLPGALELAGALAVLIAVVLAARLVRLARAEAVSGEHAKAELKRSEGRYDFLVAHLPEAFLVIEDGVIRYANEVFVRIFGVAVEDAVGKPVESFLAPESVEPFRSRHRFMGTTSTAGVHRLELQIVRPDGQRRWVDLRTQLSNWESQPTEVVLVSDRERQRRAEQRVEQLNRALIGLGADPLQNVGRIVAACGELLAGDCAFYNRLDDGRLRAVGAWRTPEGFETESRPEGHLCHEVIRRGREAGVVVVRDLARTPCARTDPNIVRFRLQTYVGCPVAFGGETLGSLCVMFRRDVEVDEVDTHTLQVLAVAVGREEDRRQSARALQEGEQRFRSLFENNPHMCFSVSAEGLIRQANRASGRVLRHGGDLTARGIAELFHPDDRPIVAGQIRDCLARPGEVLSRELRMLRADGSELWVRETVQGAPSPHGDPEVLLVCQDVSEHRRSDELRAAIYEISEAAQEATTLDRLFVSIHQIVARLMDARNLYFALYDAAEDLVSFPYFVDEEDEAEPPRPRRRGLTEYVLRTGKPLLATPEVFDELYRRGEVESIGAPSIDWLGVPLMVGTEAIGVLVVQTYTEGVRYGPRERDILSFVSSQAAFAIARKRAEEALKASEEKYRTLVDSMQDGVFLTQDFKILFANEAFAQILGRTVKDVVGRDLRGFVAPEDIESLTLRHARRMDGEEVSRQYEFHVSHADGSRVPVSLHVAVMEYRGRRATLGTLHDLTEQKRLEDQLRVAQKFEAIGQLAGGVAHDFNNLLMAIVGSAELLRPRLAADEETKELEAILSSSRRAAELIKGLLAFARRQVLNAVDLDLNEVVEQMLPILRRVIPENIAIDYEPAQRVALVHADRGQMDQILMNLAVNARDAMAQGGKIAITLARVELGAEYLEGHPWAAPGEYVRLSVADTGVGMDSLTLSHIFEPFYTTKTRGHGTGLGLAIVYGIVKQHGGMIDALSQLGEGTRFDVYLPTMAGGEPVAATPGTESAPRGAETILVVEDEAEVRRILVAVLTGLGYRVLEAADGDLALQLLHTPGLEVGLVLSDVVMPQMGGRELYEATRRRYPDLPFLFSSGYGEGLVGAGVGQDAHAGFIAKPYTISELARKVREMLDRAAPQP